jgi:hypothetical protein
VERLEGDVRAIRALFEEAELTQKLIQASRVYTILYGLPTLQGLVLGALCWARTVSGTRLEPGMPTLRKAPQTFKNLKMLSKPWKKKQTKATSIRH